MPEATLLVDTSFLGDVLCAEPLVRAAKAQFPGPLDFLTSSGGAGMLAGHPDLREVLVYDKRGAQRGLGGMLRMAKSLRARQYARVYCSHRSWRTAMMLRLSGIPERVCFDNASGAALYTRSIPYPQQLHEVERNLALIGGGDWQRPRIFPTDAERARAAELVAQLGVAGAAGVAGVAGAGFVAIAPGSIWATKRWPEEHYAALVQMLVAAGKSVVVLGGPDDCALSQRILELSASRFGLDPAAFGLDSARLGLDPANFESAVPILDLCGKTNLRESYAVLERAACLVSNDSSPMHMGVAADIPVVAVFCSTVPAFGFAPRGDRDIVLEVAGLSCRPCGIHGHPTCPETHFDCGRKTTPQMVMAAVAERT